jgi:hypothetical protein
MNYKLKCDLYKDGRGVKKEYRKRIKEYKKKE